MQILYYAAKTERIDNMIDISYNLNQITLPVNDSFHRFLISLFQLESCLWYQFTITFLALEYKQSLKFEKRSIVFYRREKHSYSKLLLVKDIFTHEITVISISLYFPIVIFLLFFFAPFISKSGTQFLFFKIFIKVTSTNKLIAPEKSVFEAHF